MTQKEGQNGPGKEGLLPENLPAADESVQKESAASPQLFTDALIERPADLSSGAPTSVPDVVRDATVGFVDLRETSADADLPMVQGDRAGDPMAGAEASQESFAGLSVLEDATVAHAIEDARTDLSETQEVDLLILEDSLRGSTDTAQEAVSFGAQAAEEAEEEEWGSSSRPLPAAIDLSAVEAQRPKSFMARMFARKMKPDPAPSRLEPVLLAPAVAASVDMGLNPVDESRVDLVEETPVAHVDVASDDEHENLAEVTAEPLIEIASTTSVPDVDQASSWQAETPTKKSWFSRGEKRSADKAKKPAKARKTPDRSRGNPPIQVIIGWIAESNRKDVIEHARGFASDHIETLDSAWISVSEFRGGHIFEVHEGGSGLAYMPEIIEQLTRDPDQVVWVPSGTVLNRVLTIRIAEDHVFSTILTEAESTLVRSSGQEPLHRTGRMVRLVPKGTAALATGVALAAVGAFTLMGAGYYSALINQQPLPSRTFNQENLPHSQIIRLSEGIRDDRWVSRIVFEDGQWRADFETVKELVLPVDDAGAQAVIDDLYNEEERIKKAVEDSIKEETEQ